MKTIKMNSKLSIIYKLVSFLLCLSGLLYQWSQLFSQYLSGKTVVNVEVKREVYENLPAFTFCFPHILSLEAIAEFDDESKRNYEEYSKIIKEIKANYTLYEHYKMKMNLIYSGSNNIYHKFLFKPEFADILINNWSLPFKLTENYASVNVYAIGTLHGKITYLMTHLFHHTNAEVYKEDELKIRHVEGMSTLGGVKGVFRKFFVGGV